MAPAHTLRTVYRRVRGEAGFTLIEVLVTVLVLVVGLLGAFATLRASAHTTLNNRERQAETSLAREVLEDAGSLPTTQLTSAALPGALQSLIASASVVSGGLQVTRGPSVYMVNLTVCSLDDLSDGYGSESTPPASGGTWCPGQTSGTADANPDDEERVSVAVTPSSDPSGLGVQQSTLIVNDGIVSCFTLLPAGACPGTSETVSYTATPTLTFSVSTTMPATSISWYVNGHPPRSTELSGSETDPYSPGSETSSTFTWTPPTTAGTYTISVQAQDAQGNTGPPSVLQITVTS